MNEGSRLVQGRYCSDSAFYGSQIGIIIVALHIIHHVIIDDIPEDTLAHVVRELIAGALGGAILFAVFNFSVRRLRNMTALWASGDEGASAPANRRSSHGLEISGTWSDSAGPCAERRTPIRDAS